MKAYYSTYHPIWQKIWDLCWDAHLRKTNVVAALIADRDGKILSTGQNTIYLDEDPHSYLYGTCLAHAEMNAIYSFSRDVQPFPDRDMTLYCSLEPCPMCFGSIIMSQIKTVHYAARDYYGGATALNGSLAFIQERDVTIHGPYPELEAVFRVLQGMSFLSKGLCYNHFVEKHTKFVPQAAALAENIYKSGLLAEYERTYAPDAVFNDIVDQLNQME